MRKVKRIYAKIGKYEHVPRESVCYRFKGVYCVYGAFRPFCASPHNYDVTLNKVNYVTTTSTCDPRLHKDLDKSYNLIPLISFFYHSRA